MDIKSHDFVAVRAFGSIILPGKGDLFVVDTDQPTVGNGDPVSVAGEIGEHRLRPGERFLGMDREVGLVEGLEIGVEGGLVGKRLMVVEEVETTVRMGLFEAFQDQAAEQAREDAHWQEELGSACNPSGSIHRDTATRHDHMHMGVVRHRRTPRVHH